jgi:hypothetical protein
MEAVMRRYVATFLFIFSVAVITTFAADDYWVKKDWHKWSKDEVKRMLQDSPWSKPLIEKQPATTDALPHNSGAAANGSVGEGATELDYYLQLRSAQPVREAFIRQQEILQNYDKMGADEKKAFDQKTDDYLKRTFDNEIVLHVVYSSNVQTFQLAMMRAWQDYPDGVVPRDLLLINERGDRVLPVRWVSPRSGVSEFEAVFPRTRNGEPIIQNTDKEFSIQIPQPKVGTGTGSFAYVRGLAQFKVDKMTVDGKLVY